MALEISIIVRDNHIFISEPQDNICFTMANLLAIYTPSQTIVEIGRSEKEIADNFQGNWTTEKSRITFQKIYEPENFKPEYFWLSLRYFVNKIRDAKYAHFVEQIFHYNSNFSLNLVLPDYEQLDTATRDVIELTLPEVVSVKKLSINGLEVETYFSHRKLAKWTSQLFIIVGMVAFILIIPPIFFGKTLLNLFEILLFMAMVVISSLIGAYVGIIVWVLAFRKLIPTRLFTSTALKRKMLPNVMWKLFEIKSG